MSESLNKLFSNEAVCRTAPATPGLLNTLKVQDEVTVMGQSYQKVKNIEINFGQNTTHRTFDLYV